MINLITGNVSWKHKTWGAVTSDPVLTNQGIFMACEDHQLYSINRSTGQDRWIYRTQVALKESPVVIGNTVYLNVPSDGLVALDQATGSPLWKLSEIGKPFALQDQLLLIGRPRKIEVVEVASGKSVMEVPVTGLQTVLAGPAKSQILVASNGRIVRLDPRP